MTNEKNRIYSERYTNFRHLGDGKWTFDEVKRTEFKTFMPKVVEILNEVQSTGFAISKRLICPEVDDWTTDPVCGDFRDALTTLHGSILAAFLAGSTVRDRTNAARRRELNGFARLANLSKELSGLVESMEGRLKSYTAILALSEPRARVLKIEELQADLATLRQFAQELLERDDSVTEYPNGETRRPPSPYDSLSSREMEVVKLAEFFKSEVAASPDWLPQIFLSKTGRMDEFTTFALGAYRNFSKPIEAASIQRTFRRVLRRTNAKK